MSAFYVRTSGRKYSIDGVTWFSPDAVSIAQTPTLISFIPLDSKACPAVIIDIATVTVDIDGDGSKSSVGYFNTDTLEVALRTVFPKANTGSAGSGTILTLTPVSTTQIDAAWTAVSGATSYALERSLAADFGTKTTVYTDTGLSFSDTGLTPGTRYYYRIKVTLSNNSTSKNATTNSVVVTNNAFTFTLPFNLS